MNDVEPFMQPILSGDRTVAPSELWRILWHRRRLILGIVALLVAVAALYSGLTPKTYVATAQVIVDPRDKQVVSNDVNPSSILPDGGVAQVESQASVVQSSNVLLRAIAATDLTADPEFNKPSLINTILAQLNAILGTTVAGAPPGDPEAKTLTALRRQLTVKRADKVLVIDVSVSAKRAEKAARLANAIVDAYMADQADARAQSADNASTALTARLAAQRRRVEEAENAVQRYRVAHNIVVATGQVVSEQQLNEVNTQLGAAQNRVSVLKAQIDQIREQRRGGSMADGTAEALQSTVVSKLREQESTLVQREAAQQSLLGPRHPAVASMASELRDIRRLIAVELDRIGRAAQVDYDRALANERALSAKLDTMKRQTLANDANAVGLRELERDLEAVRSIYASYLVRAQETREQASIDSTNARIITRALAPQQSSWPPTILLLVGALGAGLGIGGGSALTLEYVNPTVLSRSQIEALADAPVIGTVPARRRFAWWRRLFRRRRSSDEPERSEGQSSQCDNAMALALRRLFGGNGGSTSRSVLLTSSQGDGPGRTRVSRLLAAAAAHRGERVLLINAGPSDGKGSTAGLMDVLRGECHLDLAVRYEPVPHVDPHCVIAVMTPGRHRAMSREAVAFAHAKRMLSQAKQDFDLVIVDGGAMAETVNAFALAGAVAEVVLVVAMNLTPQRAVVASTERLATMGRRVDAVILVDPMARAGS